MRFFLRKYNRLTHEKDISALFNSGGSVFCYPIKMVFSLTSISDDEAKYKAMFVVSKRSFKRAVKRNLIRRRVKDVFRLNVHSIIENIPAGKTLNVALIFVSKDLVETPEIEKCIAELFIKLKNKLVQ